METRLFNKEGDKNARRSRAEGALSEMDWTKAIKSFGAAGIRHGRSKLLLYVRLVFFRSLRRYTAKSVRRLANASDKTFIYKS